MHGVICDSIARTATCEAVRRPPASRGPTAIRAEPPEAASRCASLNADAECTAPIQNFGHTVSRASISIEAAGTNRSTCAAALAPTWNAIRDATSTGQPPVSSSRASGATSRPAD